VLGPKGAKNPPETDKFPAIVEVIAVEFVSRRHDVELGETPVDCIVKFPLTVVRPPKLKIKV
jgi:hypothetical protein